MGLVQKLVFVNNTLVKLERAVLNKSFSGVTEVLKQALFPSRGVQ